MLPVDVAKGLGKSGLWFLPPSEDLDLDSMGGQRTYRWRLIMSGGMYFAIVSIAALAFLSLTHASAGDLSEVSAKLIAKEIDNVDTSICIGQESGNISQSTVNYREQLLSDYEVETGREYRHKPCDLLLSLARNRS